MMWIIYGIIGAVGKGATNLLRKKIAGTIDTDVYLWSTMTLSVPLVAVIVLLLGIPVSDLVTNMPLPILINASFYILALVLNIKALKHEELSYISPLSAFTPVFTLGLGWLVLQEVPNAVGLLGLLIMFAGAYIINLKSDQVTWYEPLSHLIKNSGARYALGVSICFAVVSITTKFVIRDGFSPVAWLLMLNIMSWILLSYVPFRKPKQLRTVYRKHRTLIVGVTIATLVGGLFGIYSIATAEFTAYAIALRRFDILFSIILGWKILQETNIRNKLIGGGLMTAGVIVVSIL